MDVNDPIIITNCLFYRLNDKDFCDCKLTVKIDFEKIIDSKPLISSAALLITYFSLFDLTSTEFRLEYDKNGKKIYKSFNFNNRGRFAYLYSNANYKFDFIYYRKYDNYSVFVYELHKNRENVVIISKDPKEYITPKTAKQIFDNVLNINNIHQIFKLFDKYIVGLYYDIDDRDYAEIVFSSF